MSSPRAQIEGQIRERMREIDEQGRRDAIRWLGVPGANAIQWAQNVVRLGHLGTVGEETGNGEVVRIGGEALTQTDCEDRVVRLIAATCHRWPGAKCSIEWVGNPPWHVRAMINGRSVETMPNWALERRR